MLCESLRGRGARATRNHLVIDTYQIQAAGWSCRACSGAIACLQNFADVLRLQCGFSNQHERSHQIPHHVVQKPAALDRVDQFFSTAVVHVETKIRRTLEIISSSRRPRSGSTAANEVKSCSPITKLAACCMAFSSSGKG